MARSASDLVSDRPGASDAEESLSVAPAVRPLNLATIGGKRALMRFDQPVLVIGAFVASAIATAAQQQVGTPGVQAGRDPNRPAFIAANCKTPAAAPAPGN